MRTRHRVTSGSRLSEERAAVATLNEPLSHVVSIGRGGTIEVTCNRIVEPTSPASSTYVVPVAPPITTQFAPPASQRCHW